MNAIVDPKPRSPKRRFRPTTEEGRRLQADLDAARRKLTEAGDAARDALWRWVPAAALIGAVLGFVIGRVG